MIVANDPFAATLIPNYLIKLSRLFTLMVIAELSTTGDIIVVPIRQGYAKLHNFN